MSQPIVIDAPNGARIDISFQVQRLISGGHYDDFDRDDRNKFAKQFASKLAIIAGPDAPAVVLNAISSSLSPEYCDHIAALWGLVDDGEDDDGDDLEE